ncbi:MAG: AAA family ATPase [Thermoplasmata archaeon]
MIESSVNDGRSGIIVLLMGTQGYGKGEFSSLIRKKLSGEGFSIMQYRAVSGAERNPYSIFESMFSQVGEDHQFKDKSEILKSLENYLASNSRGTLIVIENVHNLLNDSLEVLIDAVPILRKYRAVLIGTTIIVDETNLDLKMLINHLIEKTGINLVQLKQPDFTDFQLIATENGFSIPDELIKDIFAMTRGSISLFKNAIIYYQKVGIIDRDGRINESVSRFLPIPPSQDVFYESVIAQLSSGQRFILDTLTVMGGYASLDLLSLSVGMKLPEMLRECNPMLSMDIIMDSRGSIRFANQDYFEFYLRYSGHDRIRNTIENLRKENIPNKFPLYANLELMLASNESDSLSQIIKEEGLALLEKFPSNTDLHEFINRAKKIISDRRASKMLDLLNCSVLYRLGNTEESRICFESQNFDDLSFAIPKLILSRVYSVLGEYDKSLNLLDTLNKREDLAVRDRCESEVIRAMVFFRINRLEDSRGKLEEVIRICKGEEFEGILAEAYELMGNIEMELRNGSKALEYYSLSNEICRKNGYVSQFIINTNNSALVYDYNGDFDHEIENYLAVIRESHTPGEKRVRAYSVFNLMELYDEIGELDRASSYIEAENNLLQGLNDNYLRYLFTRYQLSRNILMEKFPEASIISENLVSIADGLDIPQYTDLSLGLKTIADYFSGGKRNRDYEPLLLKEYQINDDFLPMYYIQGLTYFFANGDIDSIGIGLERIIELSGKSGDYYSSILRKVAEYSREIFYYQKAIDFSQDDGKWINGVKIPFLKLILEFLYYANNGKTNDVKEIVNSAHAMNLRYMKTVPPLILHFIEILEAVTLTALYRNTSMETVRGLVNLDSTPSFMLRAMNSVMDQVKNVR